MGGPAGPDSALLVERELFAQEEILGRERSYRSETENQKAEQIGKKVQPKQTEFYHAPMSLVFALLPSNWSQFSPFQVTPVIFAEDRPVQGRREGRVTEMAITGCPRSLQTGLTGFLEGTENLENLHSDLHIFTEERQQD